MRVFQHGEKALRIAMRCPQRIRQVREPIEVYRTRQPDPRQHANDAGQRGAPMPDGERHQGNDDPERQPNKRKPGSGTRKIDRREIRNTRHGQPRQELRRKPQATQTHCRATGGRLTVSPLPTHFPSSILSETPASPKVAILACNASAARTIGTVSAAPVPSPNRNPRSNSGSNFSHSSATLCPASAERCEASSQFTASGSIETAARAAAVEI